MKRCRRFPSCGVKRALLCGHTSSPAVKRALLVGEDPARRRRGSSRGWAAPAAQPGSARAGTTAQPLCSPAASLPPPYPFCCRPSTALQPLCIRPATALSAAPQPLCDRSAALRPQPPCGRSTAALQPPYSRPAAAAGSLLGRQRHPRAQAKSHSLLAAALKIVGRVKIAQGAS